FAALRRWSVSSFDLILIATSELEAEARPFGLPVVVLPDPIPGVPPARPNADTPAALREVVVIASYAVDEPIDQVLEAARRCPDLRFSITGEPPSELRGRTPENVELTGYLPHADFQALLGGAACVVALTTEEGCFQRGACEALAHARPLVTSDTAALRSYLGEAAVFVEPTALAIARGVRDALARSSELERAARRRREEIRALDRANLASVLERIDAMAAGPPA
ncbi:MAG TPA: glycosyltransferase, partial [Longimicrobiales bacterium]|nr:glycosyltransferase [Longimicrobiales bacterium]